MQRKLPRFYWLITVLLLAGSVKGQPPAAREKQPDSTWIGQRIIMLKGFGEVNSPGENGQIQVKRAPNIVAPIARIEGYKVWILSPGEIQPTGWIDTSKVILLTEAIPYFSALIERNPKDWDAYFRKADAEHALNKREEAIADYTMAIQLYPGDPYLYFRRARSWHARQICDKAIADYGKVILFTKDPAEAADAYSRQAGIYANCRDSLQQNSKKAIAAAKKAVSLDHQHPTYLTLLAAAYERDGQIKKAIAAQKKALASPAFPPGYREEATKYLQSLEKENRPSK